MSRRPRPSGDPLVRAAQRFDRMAPGGMLASESPVTRTRQRARMAGVAPGVLPALDDAAQFRVRASVDGGTSDDYFWTWGSTSTSAPPAAGEMLLSVMVASWTLARSPSASVAPPAGWDLLLSGSHTNGGGSGKTTWMVAAIDSFVGTEGRSWIPSGFVSGDNPIDGMLCGTWRIDGASGLHWQAPSVVVAPGTAVQAGTGTYDEWAMDASATWLAPDPTWGLQAQMLLAGGFGRLAPTVSQTSPKVWHSNFPFYASCGFVARPGTTFQQASQYMPGEADGAPATGTVNFHGAVANWEWDWATSPPSPVAVALTVGAK